eukprot:TRINITY_DN6410_c0_g2_i1.p2 TRINITY_DN6410_c0_g2~~TRINITY_DN6410_c0_g2_i1.p2  ORF type:complete len:114 (-),score=0.43 TRINITY_DN6410_c0_g2_i1:6-347(-)
MVEMRRARKIKKRKCGRIPTKREEEEENGGWRGVGFGSRTDGVRKGEEREKKKQRMATTDPTSLPLYFGKRRRFFFDGVLFRVFFFFFFFCFSNFSSIVELVFAKKSRGSMLV